MDKRKKKLEEFNNNLESLSELCGKKIKKVNIGEQPKLLRVLQELLKDNVLYDCLENWNKQVCQVIKQVDEFKLENWNNKENEKELEKKEKEIKKLKEEKKILENNNKVLEDNNKILEDDNKNYKQKEAEWSEWKNKYITLKSDLEALQKEQLKTIKGMIDIRDNLFMRATWIEMNAPEEVSAAKVVDSQLKETARFMESMGVEIIESTGKFDNTIHTIVDTEKAPSKDKIDYISQTIRSGYRFQGEMLRFQEVILFVDK